MEIDEKYMRRALQLAKLGEGNVSPNPMVGAVIVADGKIIGEGFHRIYGEAHAEVNAVNSVVDTSLLSRATIYVTLEPCSHYGKTPPCAKLLVEKELKRVVVGVADPFPEVSGRGIAMLRAAGIEVTEGVLEDECRALNRKFLTAHSRRLPFVLLKWAQSADGFIDRSRNDASEPPVVIYNALTSMWTHRERAAVDAILVGAATARLDNPSLTVRHYPVRRQPMRVLLDASLSVPQDCNLFAAGAPLVVYNAKKECRSDVVEWVKTDTAHLHCVLADLYRRGFTSLMVEGGANVLSQFIEAGLWDEARVEIGAVKLHDGVKAPEIHGELTKIEIHGANRVKCYAKSVK